MTDYKSALKKILLVFEPHQLEESLNSLTQSINAKDLAHFFIDSLYLKSVIQLIIDDYWVQSKDAVAEISFDRFIKKFFTAELKPLLFLHAFFLSSDIEGLHVATKTLNSMEKFLLSMIKSKPAEFQKTFLQIALNQMSEHYEFEHQLNSTPKKIERVAKLSLYRTFDILDQIFELDYISNEVAALDQKERIYEGAGLGVQSSYATILLALRYLNLSKDSRFIDLGSGYGRVGLVVGLMRPDLQFTGYEFVKARVDVANKASAHFQLDPHVHFITQDLSLTDFKIPIADTYYIFDSFSDDSYVVIMDQLQKLTQQKKITVVTKGNAKLWMKNAYWSEPQVFNEGNLCFFRSRARME